MSNTKDIVCLANSKKHGGSCFAGKEVLGQKFGGWIRPVSTRKKEEISAEEQRFANGSSPKLLDIVTIPFLGPKPTHHQQENHLIHSVSDGGPPWKKAGEVNTRRLRQLLDRFSGDLWTNKSPSSEKNDRVLFAHAKNLDYSLLLIQPTSLIIGVDWGKHKDERDLRANFGYNGKNYNLAVTDPVAEKRYRKKSIDDYYEHGLRLPREYPIISVDDVYLCVSLGEEFHNYYYKLVAAIIGDED